MSPQKLFEGLEKNKWVSDQRNVDRLSEQFPNNDIRPSTNWTPQSPTLTRDEKTHLKICLVEREASYMDNNFWYNLDLSENIPEQLKKGLHQKNHSNMVGR